MKNPDEIKIRRLNNACDVACELIKELLCYSTGVSALSEERCAELVEEFVDLYPEGADDL